MILLKLILLKEIARDIETSLAVNVHTVLHIRRIRRKNQQYALIVPLLYFYVLAPTCIGSSLPSSGS
jgi:hypothetical protein